MVEKDVYTYACIRKLRIGLHVSVKLEKIVSTSHVTTTIMDVTDGCEVPSGELGRAWCGARCVCV